MVTNSDTEAEFCMFFVLSMMHQVDEYFSSLERVSTENWLECAPLLEDQLPATLAFLKPKLTE